MTYYRRFAFVSVCCLVIVLCYLLPSAAQDSAVTPSPTLEPSPTATATVTETWTPPPTDTLIPTPTPTETATPELPTLTPTDPPTATPTATDTAEEAIPLATLEIVAPTETADDGLLTATSTLTATVDEDVTEEVTPEVTSTVETLTETATASETIIASETPSPSSTTLSESLLEPIQGIATYQNHQPDAAGITITILDENQIVLSTTITDTQGQYVALVPAHEPYHVVANAPLHLRVEMSIGADEPIPPLVMAGGDLNGDGCINGDDLSLLVSHFETTGSIETDINGDGLTDAVDLAILSGNYDSMCKVVPLIITATPEPPTETPEILVTPESTPPAEGANE